jgi:hypothetical protein
MARPPPLKLPCDRPLPYLHDSLIDEILLRVPPHDPGCLVRCSAVCKPWRRHLTDPNFLGRYRAFHRVPPMLGFLFNLADGCFVVRFVRTTSFRPRTLDHAGCYVRDARHGRILFRNIISEKRGFHLFVWSPVTDERWGLFIPLPFYHFVAAVAVLCAKAAREGGCDCDHLDCHSGPFLVAFVATDDNGVTCGCVYSSETGAYSIMTCAQHPNDPVDMDILDPIVLVGNRIYFPAGESKTIVEYDLGRQKLAFLEPPPLAHQGHCMLMPAMGGGLGFASVRESCLYMWSRETGSDRTAATWTQSRVLELNTLPDCETALGFRESLMGKDVAVVGFAEGLDVIFVRTDVGVFVINLESGQVKKITSRSTNLVISYMSFYTPGNFY